MRPDALDSFVQPLSLTGSSTSYFSSPSSTLDPALFDTVHTGKLKGSVRRALVETILGHLEEQYSEPEKWIHAWIAGSGVSYQWAAQRSPGDLDVLLGVDYIQFRMANQNLAQMSDVEIAKDITEGFREEVEPEMSMWNGFEVTFYVNPDSTDIRNIQPYAAYDLLADQWTVEPDPHQQAAHNYEYDLAADRDRRRAEVALTRYSQGYNALHNAQNDGARRNAETWLNLAVDAGSELFKEIHNGRREAFSRSGRGYADWGNYRWQAGKANGVVHAMRALHDWKRDAEKDDQMRTYGMVLPSVDELVRRSIRRSAT